MAFTAISLPALRWTACGKKQEMVNYVLAKPEEGLVEARIGPDLQIGGPTWLQERERLKHLVAGSLRVAGNQSLTVLSGDASD